ncbi:unnamed protein product [Discosporangium mesarthrocarpum]
MSAIARSTQTVRPLVQGARAYRRHLDQYGTGGRSSVNDITVAIFGATGFLGRYVTNSLGRTGTRCFIPNRGDEMDHRHIKTQFDLGQVYFPYYSSTDEHSIRAAIGDADVVVNMIGKYNETKHLVYTRREDGALSRVNCSYQQANVDIAERLARIAKEQGASRFIQVSALAADPGSESAWARTKAEGEVAVRTVFPEATIVRPAKMFGHEDRFLTWTAIMAAKLGRVPLVNNGDSLLQPVDVRDVSKVMMTLIDDPENVDYRGKTVEIAGHLEYSWSEVVDFVLDATQRVDSTRVHRLSNWEAELVGTILEQFPNPYWTKDEAIQMRSDVLVSPDTDALTIADFGIEPAKMEEATLALLRSYRRVSHFGVVKGYHL